MLLRKRITKKTFLTIFSEKPKKNFWKNFWEKKDSYLNGYYIYYKKNIYEESNKIN